LNKHDLVKASLVFLFGVGSSFGAGFGLYQGSAAGNADSTYGTAKGGEPGSMYLNPAAVTTVPGTQLQLGVITVAPGITYEGHSAYTGERLSQDADDKLWPIPHLYVTHQLNDEWWIGLGAYTRFGLGAKYDEDWFGRYNIYDVSITSFNVGPMVAWKAADWISLSAGLSVQYMDITLKQKIDAAGLGGLRKPNDPAYSPLDVDQNLNADDVGFGFDLGIALKPVDKVNIGIGYHSRIEQDVEGRGKYRKPAPIAAAAPTFFNDTDVFSTVTLPDIVMSAITYDLTDKLTIGLGLTYTAWHTYDELRINFDELHAVGAKSKASEKDWSDAFRYTAGMTYQLDDAITLRASYTFDESPMNERCLDYIVPGSDRHIMAVGAGYSMEDWVFDVFYFYEIVEDQEIAANVPAGVHPSEAVDGFAHSLGFSVTRKF
jgi:long-chain fatty acid transport protein